jgi:hypothetical protein
MILSLPFKYEFILVFNMVNGSNFLFFSLGYLGIATLLLKSPSFPIDLRCVCIIELISVSNQLSFCLYSALSLHAPVPYCFNHSNCIIWFNIKTTCGEIPSPACEVGKSVSIKCWARDMEQGIFI